MRRTLHALLCLCLLLGSLGLIGCATTRAGAGASTQPVEVRPSVRPSSAVPSKPDVTVSVDTARKAAIVIRKLRAAVQKLKAERDRARRDGDIRANAARKECGIKMETCNARLKATRPNTWWIVAAVGAVAIAGVTTGLAIHFANESAAAKAKGTSTGGLVVPSGSSGALQTVLPVP